MAATHVLDKSLHFLASLRFKLNKLTAKAERRKENTLVLFG